MSALASRPLPIVVRPSQTRAVRLVETLRALPIERVQRRIEETRGMTDDEVRERHRAENRARAVAAAARMASR